METVQVETKTLQQVCDELALTVESGKATADKKDEHYSLHYTVTLKKGEKLVWSGSYWMGIGHATPKNDAKKIGFNTFPHRVSTEEVSMYHAWASNHSANFKDKQLQAEVSAKIANANKIVPEVADVVYSLISDGSAFFGSMRFEEWARELGYDTDSRKAEQIYKQCDEIGRTLSRAFTKEELDQLRYVAQNY